MTRIGAIFKREFASYFNSLMAYFFMVIFLSAVNMVYVWFALLRARTTVISHYFDSIIIAFWIFIPAITMRMWSEEKKSGTLELMMTMPIRDIEAVLGKFLASFAFLALTLLLSLISIPPLLYYLGAPDSGPIIGGYVGLLLLGSSFIAVGLAVSAMTENQFIAFLLTLMICLGLLGVQELADTAWALVLVVYFVINPVVYVITRIGVGGQSGNRFKVLLITNIVCTVLVGAAIGVHLAYDVLSPPTWLTQVESYFDAGHHFDSIGRGVIDTRDLVYYFSVIGFFLFLNYRAVASRRWE
jgi:ABC-2 type transport system permease protein